MRLRLLATALVTSLAVIGCAEGDPADINNSVVGGLPPDPNNPPKTGGTAPRGGGSGGYPAPKSDTPPAETPAATGDVEAKPAEDAKPEAPVTDEPKPDAPQVTLGEEELKEIAKLPEADQALAKAQVVCLISGELLGGGGMGVPVRVEHDGKVGFLCCKGCKGEFDKDPAAALAKLKK